MHLPTLPPGDTVTTVPADKPGTRRAPPPPPHSATCLLALKSWEGTSEKLWATPQQRVPRDTGADRTQFPPVPVYPDVHENQNSYIDSPRKCLPKDTLLVFLSKTYGSSVLLKCVYSIAR